MVLDVELNSRSVNADLNSSLFKRSDTGTLFFGSFGMALPMQPSTLSLEGRLLGTAQLVT